MKTKIIAFFAALLPALFAGSYAAAQVGEGITIAYPHMERPHLRAEGENVRVTFRMVIPARNIQQNKTIEMIPVLANRDGEASMTPILVTGKRKSKSDLRKRVLSGTNMAVMMHVVKGQAGVLDYNVTVPYAQWMSGGDLKLFLDQSKIGYNKSLYLGRIQLLNLADNENVAGAAGLRVEPDAAAADDFYPRLADLLEGGDCDAAAALLAGSDSLGSSMQGLRMLLGDEWFRSALGGAVDLKVGRNGDVKMQMEQIPGASSPARELAARESFVADKEQYWKDRSVLQRDPSGLSVYFALGQVRVDPRYKDNEASLQRILSALDVIRRDPSARLLGIRILGQASPDGSPAANKRISELRADALKQTLMARSGLSEYMFDVVGVGSAWTELRDLVAADSLITHKEEILHVLDNVPVWDSAREVGRMGSLWKVDMERPYWYMYRNLFPKLRSASYVKVYFESLEDDVLRKLGIASGLMGEGSYAGALAVLSEVRADARAWLPLAVCHAMCGDLRQAGEYLAKARSEAAATPGAEPLYKPVKFAGHE